MGNNIGLYPLAIKSTRYVRSGVYGRALTLNEYVILLRNELLILILYTSFV